MLGNNARPQDGLGRRGLLQGAAAGALATALPGSAPASAQETPKRGGTLRFATRVDGSGLDSHRNLVYYVSDPHGGHDAWGCWT